MITRAEVDEAVTELRRTGDRLLQVRRDPRAWREAMDANTAARERVLDLMRRIASEGAPGGV